MWAPIIEKAWAKIKGSYQSAEGGILASGLRALIGSPVFMYDNIDDVNVYYDLMKEAEDAGYLVAISTLFEEEFSDTYGLVPSHQYTVLALFEMWERDGTSHDMLLIRNPWKESHYVGPWGAGDGRWTDELVAQIPHNIDPRTSQDDDGVFVIPKHQIAQSQSVWDRIEIAHFRANEDYSDNWYDAIDMDEDWHSYKFKLDSGDQSGINDKLYLTVETYYAETIPSICT